MRTIRSAVALHPPYTRNRGARGDRNAMRSTGSPATEASIRPVRS